MTGPRSMRIDVPENGPLAGASVRWAADELLRTAAAAGLPSSADPEWRLRLDHDSGIPAEGFRIQPGEDGAVVVAADQRGAMYAILDLADRVRHATDPGRVLVEVGAEEAAPANRVRSITRVFISRPEDEGWFRDTRFWDSYLTELATNRFNRFSLGTGMGPDYPAEKKARDVYLAFLYPYVLDVPTYDVRVSGVDEGERAQNLAALQYIARAATLRGLDFHLGLWSHAYRFDPDDVDEPFQVHGIDDDNHAEYCRDALAALLREIPEVRGLTFRVHLEGGVREPSHAFWRTVLSRLDEAPGVAEIDFHAKGVGDDLIDVLTSTGKRGTLSPKYSAEHMGLPYHQASVRDHEKEMYARFAANGAWREFAPSVLARYSFGSFLSDHRTYDLVFRVWPGTQRFLSLGDPAAAAALGREAGFCGSGGVEWFDMMTFKGRGGSGKTGARELYRHPDLALGIEDWTKYRYAYRLRGRLSYNPDERPDVWRRFLRSEFGGAADGIERALAAASRVLPLITTTNAPSASVGWYWPEICVNVPIVPIPPVTENPYADRGWAADPYALDSTAPHTFGAVGPLDPALFVGVDEYADAVIAGKVDGRHGPLEVAGWFDALSDDAERGLAAAESVVGSDLSPGYRRAAADVRILAGMARFFAGKFRAAFAFALFERTEDPEQGQRALASYRAARAAWTEAIDAAEVYRDDLAFGGPSYLRGHWRDRLPAIDADIVAVRARVGAAGRAQRSASPTSSSRPRTATVRHDSPAEFDATHSLPLVVTASGLAAVRVFHRAVDQSRGYLTQDLHESDGRWTGEIPGAELPSDRPLQYFFELTDVDGARWHHPDFGPDLANRPYFVIGRKRSDRGVPAAITRDAFG